MDNDSLKLTSFLSQGQVVYNFGNDIVMLESPCNEKCYDFPFVSDSTICIIVDSGHMMCIVDTMTHSIDSSGMMILTRGHIVERIIFESDFKGKFIIMSRKMLDSLEIVSQFNLLHDIETKGFYPLDDESMQAVNNYYGMLQGIIRTANPYKANVIKYLTLAYLYGLGAYIHPSLSANPKNRLEEITNSFLDLVRKNCKEHRDIPFYADILRISPKHLSKAVKVTTGEKAMQWIEKYTVINAKNLLRTSYYSIAQISDILSFANPSDFGKYFKKNVGCSPLTFRKLGGESGHQHYHHLK